MRRLSSLAPLLAPGLLLGTGLGGFLDGIVLHQLLQWHNMLSSQVPVVDLPSMKYNMLWDGVFHLATWILTATGVAYLWRLRWRPPAPGRARSEPSEPSAPWSTQSFVGALCLGWGAFNLVEGVIDHFLFGIHHVHPGRNQLAWDIGFLAFGALLVGGGTVLIGLGTQRR